MTERIVRAIEHPLVDAIGHPSGRKIERRRAVRVRPRAGDRGRGVHSGTMLEINARAPTGATNEVNARAAAAARARSPIVINCDAHRSAASRCALRESPPRGRAWLTAADVANTRPWAEARRAAAPARGPRLTASRARRLVAAPRRDQLRLTTRGLGIDRTAVSARTRLRARARDVRGRAARRSRHPRDHGRRPAMRDADRSSPPCGARRRGPGHAAAGSRRTTQARPGTAAARSRSSAASRGCGSSSRSGASPRRSGKRE